MKGFSLISICILIEFHCIFNDFLCIFNDFHGFFFDFHCILLRAFEARSCPPIRQLIQSKQGGKGEGGYNNLHSDLGKNAPQRLLYSYRIPNLRRTCADKAFPPPRCPGHLGLQNPNPPVRIYRRPRSKGGVPSKGGVIIMESRVPRGSDHGSKRHCLGSCKPSRH